MTTILLVEDDVSLLDIMREILEMEQYQVVTARNGLEALMLLDQHLPDLVVSDLMMPVMDGFTLLREVRARPEGAGLPFLFLTARSSREDMTRARQLGVDDYLFKPFDSGELLTAITSRLRRRKSQQLFDTRAAHLQTITMLANVIEARDENTRGHVERVQQISLSLARALGWNSDDLIVLEYGALLHDIGKIVVPREILTKPSSLNEDEWRLMRRHVEVGAEMLAEVDHLRPAIPYVLYHHERWDGKGYPKGLAEEQIPREGRLLAIVDAFDAMTSDRPYHPALQREAALEEIRQKGGTQFDPDMVAVFLRVMHRR